MPALNPIGYPFIELRRVESTNNYAMGLLHAAMAQHGVAVFAHDQTRGRGQWNREWISDAGQNIALSLVIEPAGLAGIPVFLLSMAMANACFELLAKFMGEDELRIKWPNDIYWRDRKAAGILIENIWQGNQWRYAVAGLGVNVNQQEFGTLAGRAVSIRQVTGKLFSPIELAKQLCGEAESQYRALVTEPASVASLYRARLYQKGKQVKFRKSNRVFEAQIIDVNSSGQLVVHHGIEEKFDVGAVEWL